jgi:enoyl-CoA hydratase
MVDLEFDDGLAVVTIDRPHARNAISLETMDQLEKALDGADGAKALVLTGAGDRAFVSGGDLKELSALRTELEASSMAFRMRTICDRIARFPGPTIAALNGHALGGGAEFAVAADIRLAADDVKIGFNQVTLAIMPAWGGAERLVRWWVTARRCCWQAPAPCSTPQRRNESAWWTRFYRERPSTTAGVPSRRRWPAALPVRSNA